ncbi:MAG: hypothetical protein AAFY48_09990, partial [Bacteroidota bacterium]
KLAPISVGGLHCHNTKANKTSVKYLMGERSIWPNEQPMFKAVGSHSALSTKRIFSSTNSSFRGL